MAANIYRLDPKSAAEKAISAIGFGYDICKDLRLLSCKPGPSGSRLIELDQTGTRDLVFPGGVMVKNVSSSIKCDKGERTRFRSDVLSFHQMSEKFNQEVSLSGKIPSGLFNTMFDFKGCWQKDAVSVKSLAFDGWCISLYNVELARSQIMLSEQVKRDVPSSWDPAALAEFIEKYGTHVVVGVKMGGKDIVHIKQLQNSNLQPTDIQTMLKKFADDRFSEDIDESLPLSREEVKEEHSMPWDYGAFANSVRSSVITHSKAEEIVRICIRRGGIDRGQSHKQWLSTISQSPNVISMSFVPITSLLAGIQGSGFLTHAVNLYIRYKPPIEELHQFLEFQLPRQWAPVYGDLPLGLRHRKQVSPSLQFSFMGPKLYVNTTLVDSENRPVTGVRLYLEGKKSDHLAIHLQHLSSLPQSLQLSDDHSYEPIDEPAERGFYEPVKWSIFSHVCTAPVEYTGACIDDPASIVTKAWLEVKGVGMRKVLFLRLGFSTVASAKIRKSEWDGPSTSSRKSGGPPPKAPKMSTFVETKEKARGPEDSPGYWVVTGAKLCVEGGKISIRGKYSLLTMMSEDSMMLI